MGNDVHCQQLLYPLLLYTFFAWHILSFYEGLKVGFSYSSIHKSICFKAQLSNLLCVQIKCLLCENCLYKNSFNKLADLINLEALQLTKHRPFQEEKCAESNGGCIDMSRWARGELWYGGGKPARTWGVPDVQWMAERDGPVRLNTLFQWYFCGWFDFWMWIQWYRTGDVAGWV